MRRRKCSALGKADDVLHLKDKQTPVQMSRDVFAHTPAEKPEIETFGAMTTCQASLVANFDAPLPRGSSRVSPVAS